MKLMQITTFAILLGCVANVCMGAGVALAQTELAQTKLAQVEDAKVETLLPKAYSEDSVRWEPLGRVNPEKPVTVELINRTQEPLEYLITTHTNFRTLEPGGSIKLSNFVLPSFININATRSVGVKYGLTAKRNRVIVELKIAPGQGDTTLNIDDKGAIYLY
jgi:hypothetical protein